VTEPRRREILSHDQETGELKSYGLLAAEREIDGVPVRLTYDEPARCWWILVERPRGLAAVGYLEAKRELCFEAFAGLTADDLDHFVERYGPRGGAAA